MKPTPGPWFVKDTETELLIVNIKGTPIAEVITIHHGKERPAKKNAQLLAATPALLIGCKLAMDILIKAEQLPGPAVKGMEDVKHAIRMAIERAEK